MMFWRGLMLPPTTTPSIPTKPGKSGEDGCAVPHSHYFITKSPKEPLSCEQVQPRDTLEAEIRAFQSEGFADSVAAVGAGIEGDMSLLRRLHTLVEHRPRRRQRQRDRSRGD
jgi:hypothetical protein